MATGGKGTQLRFIGCSLLIAAIVSGLVVIAISTSFRPIEGMRLRHTAGQLATILLELEKGAPAQISNQIRAAQVLQNQLNTDIETASRADSESAKHIGQLQQSLALIVFGLQPEDPRRQGLEKIQRELRSYGSFSSMFEAFGWFVEQLAYRTAEATSFLVSTLANFLTWPLLGLAIFVVLVWSRSLRFRLAEIIPGLKLKLFGTDVLLTHENATRTAVSVEDYFSDLRVQSIREYNKLVANHDVRAALEAFVREAVLPTLNGGPWVSIRDVGGFRATIHVRDILFSDSLYQLLDYYPGGTGAGRAKSTRFGLIGKVWRTGISEKADKQNAGNESDRIEKWGMTQEEAEAAGVGKNSLAAIILKKNHSKIGVVYFDSDLEGIFGRTASEFNNFVSAVEAHKSFAAMVETLQKVSEDLRDRSPSIKIHT